MKVVLARRQNKRLIELRECTTGETVGLLRKDGTYSYHSWLGFIHRSKASRLGKPVKLKIDRIGSDDLSSIKWRDVPTDKHVQGCLTENGVFAVISEDVRVV